MKRLQDDFNYGEPFDLGPYSTLISITDGMGFNLKNTLEAALVTGTTSDVSLVCDYLLLPPSEQKREYDIAVNAQYEYYVQSNEYYPDEGAPLPPPPDPPGPPQAPLQPPQPIDKQLSRLELGMDDAYINKELHKMMNASKIPQRDRASLIKLPFRKKAKLINNYYDRCVINKRWMKENKKKAPPIVPVDMNNSNMISKKSLVEFDEYDDYEEEKEEKQPVSDINMYNPIKKQVYSLEVKGKLRVGCPVEVRTNSMGQWLKGKIVEIKGNLVCVEYMLNGGVNCKKWMEATSNNLRPKLNKKIKNELNLKPNNIKLRQSVALQQSRKKQIKVKLRIGSRVEVFSVSNNRWIDGKLKRIKKDLICVAYGDGFNTEKWLKSNSKQCRPKLDMVDDAYLRQNNNSVHDYSIDNNNNNNNDNSCYTHNLMREQYEEDSVQRIERKQNKRGDLKIKIHGALQLQTGGNFAQVILPNHSYALKTKKKVATNTNPVWKEVLRFTNFRPQIGKTAVIKIGNRNMYKEKIIGKTEFELPIVFNRQEKMTLGITDYKHILCGIVVMEQVIVDHGK